MKTRKHEDSTLNEALGSEIQCTKGGKAAKPAVTTYQLSIAVRQSVRITVGRLGEFLFPVGRYIYTGSATRNIDARIARHLRKEKKLHWHIDWLLATSGVEVVSVKRSVIPECDLNRKGRGTTVAPGFGASDCKNACGSHLLYLGRRR